MRLNRALLLLIPLILTGLLYWPSLFYPIAWGNAEILEQSSFWGPAFFRPISSYFLSTIPSLFDDGVIGFRFASLAFHLLNVALLMVVLWRADVDRWLAVTLSTVWAIIPLHASTLTLVEGQPTLISTSLILFGFLALLKSDKLVSIVVSTVLFCLAVLTYEASIAGAILAVIYMNRSKRFGVSAYLLALPFVIYFLVEFIWSQSPFILIENYGWRVLTFPLVYGSYFFESLSGARMTISDAVLSVNAREISDLSLMIGLFLAAVVLQVVIWRKVERARKYIVIFNVMLLPFSQIIPTQSYRSDIFIYAASIGWWGMLWATLFKFVRQPKWQMTAMSVVVIALGVGLYTYLPVFKSKPMLVEYTLDNFPKTRMANYEYGVLALESGNTSSALAHFNQARDTNPHLYSFIDNTQLSVEMASLVMQNGQYERALAMYQEIEETQGLTTKMKLDIGVCYKNIGQPENAYDYLVAFQKEYPNDLRGMEKMSELYIDLGRKNDAIEELNRILKYFPEHSNRDGINRAIQALREAR